MYEIRSRVAVRSGRILAQGLLAAIIVCSSFIGGCAPVQDMSESTGLSKKELCAQGEIKPKAVSGPTLEVSLPAVFKKGNDLHISGTVKRLPGVTGPIPGFLDLQIIGPDGDLIDESLIHWEPAAVPSDGDRTSEYSARMLGIPPVGSTVQVSYVARVTDLKDLPESPGGGGSGGGASGGRGGGGSRSSGGSHGGGFGSGFGVHAK